VQDGFEDENSKARIVDIDEQSSAPVQAMGILKAPGSNAVKVAKDVRAKLDELQKQLPPNMKVEVLFDTTGFIKESVNEIGLELVLAVILTAIVCWLFLGSAVVDAQRVVRDPDVAPRHDRRSCTSCTGRSTRSRCSGCRSPSALVVDDAVMVMENIYRHAEMGKTASPPPAKAPRRSRSRRSLRRSR